MVPTSTHISRLIAARFQLDLLKSTMLLIARTDSESAKLISSTVDAADHEFILGTTTAESRSLAQVLDEAEASGASGAEVATIEKEWIALHEMCTFNQGNIDTRLYPTCEALISLCSCRERHQAEIPHHRQGSGI